MSSQIKDQKSEKLLILKDYDNTFKRDQRQEEYLFRCSETTTVYELKCFLKKQISVLNDYEIMFAYKVFQGDDNERIYNLIDPKKSKIEIKFKIKKENQYQEKKQEFSYLIHSEVNNEQNIEYENPIKSADQITLYNQDQQQPESKIHTINKSKIQIVSSIIEENWYNNIQKKQFDQTTDIQQDSQPFQTKIETQIKGYCEQILQEYNLRLEKVEQKLYYQSEIKNEMIQKQIIQMEQFIKNNQFYFEYTKELINNNQIQRLNILEQENFKIKEDFKQIQLEIQNLKQMTQMQNQTQSYKIVPSQIPISKQISQDLSESQQIITLKCRDIIRIESFQDIIYNAIIQGNQATCQTCFTPITSSDCLRLGYDGDTYLQIQNENQLSLLKVNIQRNSTLQILKCHQKNCYFFCIYDIDLMLIKRFYYCPLCLQYSVYNPFNSEFKINESQKNNSRIYNR